MSKVTVTIDTGNAAFDGDAEMAAELHRIFTELAEHVYHHGSSIPLFDSNGNKVGRFQNSAT